jgi:HK97 family phage major capsid protein
MPETAVLKNLQDHRLKCWTEATAIAEKAAVENRSMEGEEQRQYTQWTEDMDKTQETITRLLNAHKAIAQSGEEVRSIVDQPVDPGAQTVVEYANGGKTAEQEAAELRTFLDPKNRGGTYQLRLPTAVERRSLLDSTTPLPTSFVGQLYRYLVDTSSIRQANPTVFSTVSGENLAVPRSTAEGVATWVAEGAALTASDPTLSSVILGAYKVAKLLQISTELLADTGFDIVGFMAEHAGRNLGIAVDTAYVAGTGTTQPTGFLGAAVSGFTAANGTGSLVGLPTSGSAVGADVLIELYHSILPQYRPRATFVMNDSTIKVVRKLKDTTGQYLWQPALVAGQPDLLLGRPCLPDPHVPAIGTANTPIAFGDFAGYFIRDVTPIRFERSDDFAFGNDLVSFRAIYRTDGKLGDAQAVKVYTTGAS